MESWKLRYGHKEITGSTAPGNHRQLLSFVLETVGGTND